MVAPAVVVITDRPSTESPIDEALLLSLNSFLSHSDRVFDPDYCPTSYDMIVWRSYTFPERQEMILRGTSSRTFAPNVYSEMKVVLESAQGQASAWEPAFNVTIDDVAVLFTVDTRLFTTSANNPNADVMRGLYVQQLEHLMKHTRNTIDIILVFTNVGLTSQTLKPYREGCRTGSNDGSSTLTQMISGFCNDVRRFMDFDELASKKTGELYIRELEASEMDYSQLRDAVEDIVIQRNLRFFVLERK